MNKLVNKIERLKSFRYIYEVGIFLALFVIFLCRVRNSIDGFYIGYLLYDYSHGYMRSGFFGEILRLFTDKITLTTAYVFSTVTSLFLIAAASFFLGAVIRNCPDREKTTVTGIVWIFVIFPLFFSSFFGNALSFDAWLVALTLLAVLFARNKYLKWLIPLLGVLATLINAAYSVSCMTLMAIVILYVFMKKKSFSNAAVCLLTYGGIIGVSLFALTTHSSTSFASEDEMFKYMMSKTDIDIMDPEFSSSFAEFFASPEQIYSHVGEAMAFKELPWTACLFILAYLPLALMFGALWAKAFRASKIKSEKFVFLLCIVELALPLIPGLFSGDAGRWSAFALLVECGLVFFMAMDKNEAFLSAFDSMRDKARRYGFLPILSIIYFSMIAGA